MSARWCGALAEALMRVLEVPLAWFALSLLAWAGLFALARCALGPG